MGELYDILKASGLRGSAGGGSGFTPTQEQLDAMNSGIDSTKVEQIETNKNNILLKANTSDVNTATANLQAQINELITPVTQDAEVQNARVGADGTSYNTLKARLDAEYTTLSSGLSDTATAVNDIKQDVYVHENITDDLPVSEAIFIKNGVEDSNPNYFTVKNIPVEPNTSYIGLSNNSPFLAANSFCRFINYYDSSKNYLSYVEDVPVDFTTPSNAHYMSITFYYIESAHTDTKGNYGVLEYVNPIEYTDSKFADVPTNICVGLPILNATYIREGEYSSINGYFSVEYIPVDSELPYSGISNNASGLSVGCFARFLNYYDSSKTYIGCYDSAKDVPINFELPPECAYISITFYYTNVPNRKTGVYGVNEPEPWYNGLTQDIVKICTENASVWFNKTFVSLGDSITWQDGKSYPSGGTARGYQTILKEQLLFKEYNNMGRSGYPMTDGIPGTVGTVTTGLSITYDEYDLVIIAAGTNDFKLNAPLGTVGIIGDTNFDRETFCGAYRTLLEFILTDKPTIRIVLFTPLQRDNDGYDVNYVNSAGCKLSDYVNAIKQIAELYSIPVCDMYANSGFTELTLSTYTRDGLHPNDTGYQRMGNYAAKFIDSIGV